MSDIYFNNEPVVNLLDDSEIQELKDLKYDYTKKAKKAFIDAKKREYELEIKAINNSIKEEKEPSNLTASKFFMLFILINCTIIEIYSMVVMVKMQDLSALSSLIASVITESISYAVYCAKAYRSKKSEVEAELNRDRFEFEKENALEEIEKFEDFPEEGNPEVMLGGRLLRKRR